MKPIGENCKERSGRVSIEIIPSAEYAWVMADAILFNKPIPAKGKQGLWNWEGGIQDGQ